MSNISEIKIRRNMTIYKLMVQDETGICQITWFNQNYLKAKFKKGEKYKFFGKVKNTFGKIDMISPVFDFEGTNKNTGKIIPIYPLTYNLTQNIIRQIIDNGIKEIKNNLEETLPEYILKEYNLENINFAISQIHFPENFQKYNQARKRLVFEELLIMQLALLNLKNKNNIAINGISFDKKIKMSDIINKIPFKLTKAQVKVLDEIENDMESIKPMNRLLQGDVGSRQNYCGNDCCI